MKGKTGLYAYGMLPVLMISLQAGNARQNQTQRVPRYDAAAVVKLVPVRVLDADGRPVRGLRKEDFTLSDNNELKTITEFEVHVSDEIRVAAEKEGMTATPAQPESHRKYFFVLDMQAGDIYGNRDAKKAALEFAETRLTPGDEAGVMTFGGLTGLVLKQFLTSDLQKIRTAISRAKEMGGGGGSSEGGSMITGAAAPTGRSGNEEDAEQEIAKRKGEREEAAGRYTAEAGEEGRNTRGTMTFSGRIPVDTPFAEKTGIAIDVPGLPPGAARSKADFDTSMSELAQAMKFISGSKSVVYFSTRTPGKKVARLFAEANATIYSVNINSVPAKGGGPGAGPRREVKKLQGEALKDFAEASGGHYFADVKDAKTIAQNIEVLSGNYYILGYYIHPSWDGRSHEIKVDVKRPNVRILVQSGYSDPQPFSRLSDLEKKMELFDLALSDKPASNRALDLPLKVLFGSAMKETNTAILLKLAVEERTGLLPEKTEVFTFIFDGDNKIVLAERGEIDLTSHAQETFFPYLLAQLLPGTYECRAVVRGLESGQAAAARVSFTVPTAAVGLSLSSPLLLIPSGKTEFVRMAHPEKKGMKPVSLIRFYPNLPRNCAPLLGELPPDTKKILVLLPFTYGTEEPPEAELNVQLVREIDGEKIPIDWSVLNTRRAEPGKDDLLIGFDISGLPPGIYRLEFSIGEIKTETTSVVSDLLIIKSRDLKPRASTAEIPPGFAVLRELCEPGRALQSYVSFANQGGLCSPGPGKAGALVAVNRTTSVKTSRSADPSGDGVRLVRMNRLSLKGQYRRNL